MYSQSLKPDGLCLKLPTCNLNNKDNHWSFIRCVNLGKPIKLASLNSLIWSNADFEFKNKQI